MEDEQLNQRSFFSVKDEEEGNAYVTIETAIKTESYREQLLTKMISLMENLLITMKMFKQDK